MKKLILGSLALISILGLVACGNKEEVATSGDVTPVVVSGNEITEPVAENTEVTEQQPLSAEESDKAYVALVIEESLKQSFPDAIEEVIPTEVKIYSAEEISGDEAIKSHNVGENDIVFSANYEIKLLDDFSGEKMQFTAGTGEVDGQMIKNKSNVGIIRVHEDGTYTLDAFGTGF